MEIVGKINDQKYIVLATPNELRCTGNLTNWREDELVELQKKYNSMVAMTTPPDPIVRKKALETILKKLEGHKFGARDNNLSAHAAVCDIVEMVKMEIEYPSEEA